MLYSRASILARYLADYVAGFLHCEREFLDDVALFSRYGDGYAQEGTGILGLLRAKRSAGIFFAGLNTST